MIGAIVAAAALMVTLAVIQAPGEDLAPGMISCWVGPSSHLEAELEEVI